MNERRWIELQGAVNVRDLGGLRTTDGRTTRFGRVLRADNLQDLTGTDIGHLTEALALRDVIDLRTGAEVRLEGPGPLTTTAGVTIHHLSLFNEDGLPPAAATIDADKVLPWQTRADQAVVTDRAVGHYLAYVTDRPDSVLTALRVLAHGTGSAIVHCAAGKDRTGVICALALDAVGVDRRDIVADYAQTAERVEAILTRLRSSETYAADLDSRPDDSHVPLPRTMEGFLGAVDATFGGTPAWLDAAGWTTTDQDALTGRLLAG